MTQNLKIPEVTIDEAKMIIKALASTQSVLLLSPPGVGKSDLVQQVAAENGLECKSLLGTLPLEFNDPVRVIIHPCPEQDIVLVPGGRKL